MPRTSPTIEGIEPDLLFDEAFLRQLGLLEVIARRFARGEQRGERRTSRRGSGVEFADHRPYVPGDDIRRVDWGILGRLDQTLVRQYEEEEDLPVHLLCDLSASMRTQDDAKLRLALQTAAAVAFISLAGLDRVSVTATAGDQLQVLPSTRGKAQFLRILRFLKDAPRGGGTDLRAAVRRFCASHRQAGVVVFVSDFYDLNGASEALAMLRHRRHQVTCVQILDAREYDSASLTARGDLSLDDVETRARTEVTISTETLLAYQRAHTRFCEALARDCRQRGIAYVRADARTPLRALILEVLRRGGLLR